MHRTLAISLAAALSTATVRTQGQVWTVGGPGSNFPSIQSAVDFAADGDTLLVRPGDYGAFTVIDKGLAIVADPAGAVQIQGEVRIESLAFGKQLILSGVEVSSSPPLSQPQAFALRVRNNLGSIRIQDSSFSGHEGLSYDAPAVQAGFMAFNADVAVANSTFQGGAGYSGIGGFDGGRGLSARGCNLALYGCTLQGGHGGSDISEETITGGNGGNGFESPDGVTFASGCTFQGGHGGQGGEEDGVPPLFGSFAAGGGDGGHGILLGSLPPSGADPRLRTLDCIEAGGLPGTGGPGFHGPDGPPGDAGMPLLISNGTHTPVSGAAGEIDVISPARELTSVTLNVTGEPGDRVWLVMSSSTAWSWSLQKHGVQIPALPGLIGYSLGVIGPSGQLSKLLSLGDLGVGVQARTRYLQTLHVDPAGAMTLGTPRSLVVLDQQF